MITQTTFSAIWFSVACPLICFNLGPHASPPEDCDRQLADLIPNLPHRTDEEILAQFGAPPVLADILHETSPPLKEISPELQLQLQDLELARGRALFAGDYRAAVKATKSQVDGARALGEDDWRYREAVAHLHDMEIIATLNSSDVAEIRTAYDIERQVRQLYESGGYDQAVNLLKQEVCICARLLSLQSLKTANALDSLGYLLNTSGRDLEAQPYSAAGLLLRLDLLGPQHPHVGTNLNNLAGIVGSLGRLDSALSLQLAAANLTRQAEGELSSNFANAINNIGNVCMRRNDPECGCACFKRALEISRQVRADDLIPETLHTYGEALNTLGRYRESEQAEREALALERIRLGDEHPDVANILNSLAVNCIEQGRLEEATELLRETIRILVATVGESHPMTQSARNNLATCSFQMEDIRAARSEYLKTLAQANETRGPLDPITVGLRTHVAWCDLKLGKIDETAVELREIICLTAPRLELQREYLQAASKLASVVTYYPERFEHPEIDQVFSSALLTARGGDPALSMDLLMTTGNAALYGNHDPETAQGRFERAIEIFGELRTQVTGDELSQAMYGSHRSIDVARSGLLRAMTCKTNPVSASIAAEIFTHYEAGRSRALLELLKRTPPGTQVRRGNADSAAPAMMSAGLTGAQLPLCLQPGEIMVAYDVSPKDSLLATASADNGVQVCSLTLPDGRPVTQDWLQDRIVRILSRLEQDDVRDPTPSQQLSTFDVDLLELSEAMLPARVLNQIARATRVIVVPDGPLCGVPFELMPLRIAGEPWVAAGPPIVCSPSMSLLHEKRASAIRRLVTTGPALVGVGNPQFASPANGPVVPENGLLILDVVPNSAAESLGLTPGDVLVSYDQVALLHQSDLGSAIQAAEFESKQTTKIERWRAGHTDIVEAPKGKLGIHTSPQSPANALRDFQLIHLSDEGRYGQLVRDNARDRFGTLRPLPGSAVEVDAISAEFVRAGIGSNRIRSLIGQFATVSTLAHLANAPRYLHLATHALVDGGPRVWESALALTQPAEPTPEDTGFLRLADLLSDWGGKLNGTELVVLSACQTARGRYDAGEGFVGLTWGFLYAGADSVIASLWKVDDGATVLLMDRLYENLLGNFTEPRMGFAAKTPMPKAEALHEAKRWLRAQPAAANKAKLHELGYDVDAAERAIAAERAGAAATQAAGDEHGERNGSSDSQAGAVERGAGRRPSAGPTTLADPFDYSSPRYWAAFVLTGSPD